ncbi:MAG: polyvinylalcohol dehydrogenase, partial [Gammaproteobacteria bacterium]|nr:polyvinylalcohol dehydrogenase [Gammaproteobacteria bacterium]
TPRIFQNYVYATTGYGVGCMLAEFDDSGLATSVYENKVMKNKHDGTVVIGDHLYGYSNGGGWTCQDILTGKRVWRERGALGKGSVGYADGMLYCLSEDDGIVALVEATPEAWNEVSRFTLSPQTELRKANGRIWTHPVIVDGRLYLRDQELLFCFDVKAK